MEYPLNTRRFAFLKHVRMFYGRFVVHALVMWLLTHLSHTNRTDSAKEVSVFGAPLSITPEFRRITNSAKRLEDVLACKAQWSLYVPLGLTFKKFYVLPTQCIYVFCVDLRT